MSSVEKISQSKLPTTHGNFDIAVFAEDKCKEHVVISKGDLSQQPVLVRVHSECLTGEVLGSKKCDCGPQLDRALDIIGKEEGAVLYLRQEGRGIGLGNKIKAYALQDQGMDTVEANEHLGFGDDERDYALAADILKQLGLTKIKLMTNNPRKIEGLEKEGIEVVERVPIVTDGFEEAEKYMEVKKEKLGHMLD